jgi:hypothetical protein
MAFALFTADHIFSGTCPIVCKQYSHFCSYIRRFSTHSILTVAKENSKVELIVKEEIKYLNVLILVCSHQT